MSPKQSMYVHVIALMLIVVAFTAVHGVRFSANLHQTHWEDELFFNHSAQNVHSIVDCFRTPSVWPGLYRPLTTNCYYYFGRETFNNRIEIYHAINAMMICINGWLLYLFFQRLLRQGGLLPDATIGRNRTFALLAIIPGLLFVTRRAHAEVVLNTVEFQALFYVFAGFIMLLLVTTFPSADQPQRGNVAKVVGASLCLFVALLSKEAAISIGAIWIVILLLLRRTVRSATFLIPLVISGIWAFLFVGVFRGVSEHEPTGFSYLPTFDNVLTNFGAYFFSFFNWTSAGDDSVMSELAIELASSPMGKFVTLFLLIFAVGILLYMAMRAALQIFNRQRWHSFLSVDEFPPADEPLRVLLGQYLFYIGFSIAFFFLATTPFVLFEDRLFARYGYLGHAGIAMAIGFMSIGVVTLLLRLFNRRQHHKQEQMFPH